MPTTIRESLSETAADAGACCLDLLLRGEEPSLEALCERYGFDRPRLALALAEARRRRAETPGRFRVPGAHGPKVPL